MSGGERESKSSGHHINQKTKKTGKEEKRKGGTNGSDLKQYLSRSETLIATKKSSESENTTPD